ncbi:hypothetical protein CYMTET_46076 [Cymbomonas tetramitiformis]|uniref:Helicase ATP-binding domain-containing protein n=1 Tax=Cymbomonas tetramitiformis TaxID=36881 RepID=A0AAE0EZ19_9CHLO|nr:hypothetical protein CYMTET_46076 [Cymbomonas tetramitiformis]|eukprot:gene851-1340_t
MNSTVILKDYQDSAARLAYERLSREGLSQFLVGSVGAGKTAVALQIFRFLASDMGRCEMKKHRPCLVLLLCPNCVLRQWEDEAPRLGIPTDNVLVYHGDRDRRVLAYEKWGARARASLSDTTEAMPFLCLTTYETFRSDMASVQPRLRIPWNLVTMDEAHVLRNGVEKSPDEESRLILKTYISINEHLFLRFHPRMLFVTATVVMNHQLDAYSLVRWIEMPRNLLIKRDWYERTPIYKEARSYMVAKHVTHIDVPLVPGITMLIKSIDRNERETGLSTVAYDVLRTRLAKFRRALSNRVRGDRMSEAQRLNLKIARNAFLAAVTRCRRGELHPYFFVQHMVVDNSSNESTSTGKKILQTNKQPQFAPEEIDSVIQEYPLTDCSKMNAAVEWCRSLTATGNEFRKGLVMCDYKQPLQLLAQYLRAGGISSLTIFEHYGGGGKSNVTKLRTFQELPLDVENSEAAVLLATRGSMGVGVNLYSVQRTFLMNLGWSCADDTQALGRMQRPLVQKTHEWFATRTVLSTKDDEVTHKSLFTVEEWMHSIQDSKQNMATELFQESMVDLDKDADTDLINNAADNISLCDNNVNSMNKSLHVLQTLLDTKHRNGCNSEKDIKRKSDNVSSQKKKVAKA